MNSRSTDPAGVINPTELYTLRAFKARLGVTDATLRAARRAGLHVSYGHKQGFIYGQDWIDYIRSINDATQASPTPVNE